MPPKAAIARRVSSAGPGVLPRTTAEVAAAMRVCNEMRVPVVPRGAGTSLSGGALPLADGVVISSSASSPCTIINRSRSTSAFHANAVPVSRWHQLQWQAWTMIGARQAQRAGQHSAALTTSSQTAALLILARSQC